MVDVGEVERKCLDCEEMTRNEHGRCRDCDIEYLLDSMQCSGCKRMHYTRDEKLAPIAASFWGDRCVCEPRPPTVYEARMTRPLEDPDA